MKHTRYELVLDCIECGPLCGIKTGTTELVDYESPEDTRSAELGDASEIRWQLFRRMVGVMVCGCGVLLGQGRIEGLGVLGQGGEIRQGRRWHRRCMRILGDVRGRRRGRVRVVIG